MPSSSSPLRSIFGSPVTLLFTLALVSGCPTSEEAPPDAGVDAPVAMDAPASDDAPAAADAPVADDAPVDAACTPSTIDPSGIGGACTTDGDCPSGYVCQGFSGVVFTQSCQIRCDGDPCACPSGTVCTAHSDKAGSWFQCDLI